MPTLTIADTQILKPGQVDLMSWPLSPKARDMERIRCEKKAAWRAGPNRNSHLWGAVGEILVCDLLGVEPDWEQKDTDEGIDGMFGGVTFDVKVSTFHGEPHLKVAITAKYYADVFVLVHVDLQGMKAGVVGWATQREIKQAPVRNYKPDWRGPSKAYPDNYVLTEKDLHPMAELFEMRDQGTLAAFVNNLNSMDTKPDIGYTGDR